MINIHHISFNMNFILILESWLTKLGLELLNLGHELMVHYAINKILE
jgi:hypothetical protein